jgi:hypothetical protein
MVKGSQDTAKDIYQRLLDDISLSYEAGDFDAFTTCFDLPHTTYTFEKSYTIKTLSDLRSVFDNMRAQFSGLGVTNYIRVCLTAEYLSPSVIRGTHVTHVTKDGHHLEEPYPVMSHLNFTEGLWKVAQSENAVEDTKIFGMAVRQGLNPTIPARLSKSGPTGEKND